MNSPSPSVASYARMIVPSGCAWPNAWLCPVWYWDGVAALVDEIGWVPSRFSTGMKLDMIALLLSPLRHDRALEEPVAHGHVTGPSNELTCVIVPALYPG